MGGVVRLAMVLLCTSAASCGVDSGAAAGAAAAVAEVAGGELDAAGRGSGGGQPDGGQPAPDAGGPRGDVEPEVGPSDPRRADGGAGGPADSEPLGNDTPGRCCGDTAAAPPDDAAADTGVWGLDGWSPDGGAGASDGAHSGGTDAPALASVEDALLGRWEMVAIADSGDAKEPVPAGQQFYVFFPDHTLRFSCEALGGPLWTLSQGDTVIEVDLGGSTVHWAIQELTGDTFVFYEGGDLFYFERREGCAAP